MVNFSSFHHFFFVLNVQNLTVHIFNGSFLNSVALTYQTRFIDCEGS